MGKCKGKKIDERSIGKLADFYRIGKYSHIYFNENLYNEIQENVATYFYRFPIYWNLWEKNDIHARSRHFEHYRKKRA